MPLRHRHKDQKRPPERPATRKKGVPRLGPSTHRHKRQRGSRQNGHLYSWKGDILRLPTRATSSGITSNNKEVRKNWRHEQGFGLSHSNYNQRAWVRTDRGPQRSWLHKIGKADSPACPHCGHEQDTGHHITFECPKWETSRRCLIGDRKDWSDLDNPIWIKTGPDKEELIEGAEE